MRDRWLALYGALTTILSISFGAFMQELLVIRLFSSEAPSVTPGNIQRAQTWQNYTGGGDGGFISGLNLILLQQFLLKPRQVVQHLW